MRKQQAIKLSRTIRDAGMENVSLRHWSDGISHPYAVDYTDPQTGYSVTVTTVEQWQERVRAAQHPAYLD